MYSLFLIEGQEHPSFGQFYGPLPELADQPEREPK